MFGDNSGSSTGDLNKFETGPVTSATIPYTCNADGTVTITYDTPTGPAAAVHEPA